MALVGTGQITVVDVNDGLDANLTNDSAVLPADSIGNVSSFAGAETTFVIREAGVNTSASWTFYVSATGGGISYRDSDDAADRTGTGTTNGLITGTTGYVKVTALSQDLSYLDITATKGSLTVVKRFSVVKAKAGATGATGATGANGTRGTITTSQATSETSWVDSEAVTAIANAGGGTPIQGDVVTLYNNAQNFSQTRVRSSGGTWTALTALFGGDVIVDNTLDASKIVADSITAGKIAAGAIGATQIAASAITSTKIAAGAIAVGTAAIADGAIVNAMIGNLSADKITAGTIDAARIGANSITADKINGTNLAVVNGTFSGSLQAATGTFTGALSAATGTFAGRLTAGTIDPGAFAGIVQNYGTPGTYTVTVPSGTGWSAINMRFTLQGAGGGGGGGAGSANSRMTCSGGGGGAGSSITVTIANVTPGSTYGLTIGAGGYGAPVSTTGQTGGWGGSTTLAGYVANGGQPGTGGDPYRGVAGVGGSIGGGSGITSSDMPGYMPWRPGGYGGSSAFGGGGGPDSAGGIGAGGGGGSAGEGDVDRGGAPGGGGMAIIEFYDPNAVVTNTRYSNLITWLDSIGHGAVPANAR